MKLSSPRNQNWIYLALSFAIPVVGMLALLMISGCVPFGSSSMLYSDMWHQYYPFFRGFREALLNGESLLYNWDVGMGIDYLGLIAYYLASPLYLLSVLIPESWTLEYFALLVPIKLGFAGLFFAIFLKKTFGKTDIFLPLFSAFYALCAWALGYQWNIMWLDAFAMLPLVAMGALSLLKERKFLLYTVTLFLSVFSNYYIGFFTCIFVFLVFFCYQICCCKSGKRFFADLGCIAVFSVLAIGMTAVLFLPGLAALGSTQSSVNTFPEGFALNIVDRELSAPAKEAWQAWKDAVAEGTGSLGLLLTAVKKSVAPLLNGMRQIAGNVGGGLEPTLKEGLPNLYCGVGTVVFAFLFLTAKNVRLREKFCCVVLLLFFMLSFLVRQLDYIWHGFHFTNMIPYRFSFLFSFVMLYMAYRALRMRHRFQLWQLIMAGVLTVGLLLCSSDRTELVYIVYNGVFFLLYIALMIWDRIDGVLPPKEDREERQLYFADRAQRRKYAAVGLAVTMGLEIVINLVNFGVNFVFTNVPDYPKGTAYTASMIRYMKEDDDDFYRAEVTHNQTLNDGSLNSYSGISTFTSSANVRVTQFMRNLGYAARNTYNRYTYEESSPVANLFLNLKYLIERDGNVEENPYFKAKHSYGGVYLLENQAYLPLGFLAKSSLGTFQFSTYGNAFLFQNQLFKSATGLRKDVWHLTSAAILDIEPNNTVVTTMSAAGSAVYNNGDEKTKLTYRYAVDESGFMCLDLSMTAQNFFSVYRNGELLYTEKMALDQTLAVSQVEPGDVIEIIVTCNANESGTVKIRAAILDEEVFRQGYEILSASTLDLTSFSNTKVEGTVNCNRDGLLYTSIPQDGNWSVTVDGEEAEIVLVGDAMIAVELTEGEHTLCFTYENRAFSLGWKISLVCLLIFAAITAVVYWPKFRKKLKK